MTNADSPRVLCIGSLNIDHVHRVARIVRPGETAAVIHYERRAGGKGGNQAVALAHAGADVTFHGAIGEDGRWLCDELSRRGVDVTLVDVTSRPTGHAMIQVAEDGENAILVTAGANAALESARVAAVIGRFGPGDWLVTQNETPRVREILAMARARGLTTVWNPSPWTADLDLDALHHVDWLVANAHEGEMLSGERDPEAVVRRLRDAVPTMNVVLTLGSEGALCLSRQGEHRASSPPVAAVDSTGAGDTFLGYFVAECARGGSIDAALELSCQAASIAVTRRGALESIPRRDEVRASAQ